ncbi:MAG: hypothetical protein RI932_1029 [Pseudomonadota bacterium]|jgi:aromatic ring-opening dioxygenase catalytic subunit (LigB family)
MSDAYPTVFVSHGGGPCFWMEWNPPYLFHGLRHFFEQLPHTLSKLPAAIVVISAHWEEEHFTIQSTAKPQMIYDYTGFPKNTYELSYPASGSPDLTREISQILKEHRIAHALDAERGYDHGVYVPLLIAYPNADIPVLQISLRADLDPVAHFELGRALKPLREKNILILGSGFSYHNLRGIPDRKGVSQTFDRWLAETLCQLEPGIRRQNLLNWSVAPNARQAHPREEHLLPLLVCAGAGEFDSCTQIFSENLSGWNVQTSCFQFGF